MMLRRQSLAAAWVFCLGFLLFFGFCHQAVAADTNKLSFEVRLIWGSNGEKPKDPKAKEVDSKLRDKLKTVLKWKDYYEVNVQPLESVYDEAKKLTLSDKCELVVVNRGDSWVDVKLFGEGKLVQNIKQQVPPGDTLMIGGNDKNDTAWIVVLTRK